MGCPVGQDHVALAPAGLTIGLAAVVADQGPGVDLRQSFGLSAASEPSENCHGAADDPTAFSAFLDVSDLEPSCAVARRPRRTFVKLISLDTITPWSKFETQPSAAARWIERFGFRGYSAAMVEFPDREAVANWLERINPTERRNAVAVTLATPGRPGRELARLIFQTSKPRGATRRGAASAATSVFVAMTRLGAERTAGAGFVRVTAARLRMA